MMLSERDKAFMLYWEKERTRQNSFASKLLSGLPMAMLFSLPILLLILAVYLFFPEWYMKISNTSQGSFITIVIAVFFCVIFFSYFRMHYKWEMNEQIYQELKAKAQEPDAAIEAKINS